VNNTRPFAWSYSALTGFETCPKRHWHYNIAKDIKEEENSYQREGTDTHAAFDRYLKDQVELPLGLGHWKPMLDRIINGRGRCTPSVSWRYQVRFNQSGGSVIRRGFVVS
jgi:hypothetical protein